MTDEGGTGREGSVMTAQRPAGRRHRRGHPDRGAVAILTVLAPAWAWYFLHYGYVPPFVAPWSSSL